MLCFVWKTSLHLKRSRESSEGNLSWAATVVVANADEGKRYSGGGSVGSGMGRSLHLSGNGEDEGKDGDHPSHFSSCPLHLFPSLLLTWEHVTGL